MDFQNNKQAHISTIPIPPVLCHISHTLQTWCGWISVSLCRNCFCCYGNDDMASTYHSTRTSRDNVACSDCTTNFLPRHRCHHRQSAGDLGCGFPKSLHVQI